MERGIVLNWKKLILGSGFIIMWVIGTVCVSIFFPIEREQLVIFAGGGSVDNYLKYMDIDLEKPDCLDIPKFVYINMPSEYSWQLLKEEIDRFKDEKNPDKHSFLYICLSAKKICEDSVRLGKLDSDSAQVYGVYIGEDPLCVYVKGILKNMKDTITIKELSDTIVSAKDKGVAFYTTSRESGTYKAYESKLDSNGVKILESSIRFYKLDNLKKDNIMVLSSKYYKPNNASDFKKITVLDNNKKDTIKKELYIYFVAYKDGNQYILNKHVGTFLKKLIDKECVNISKGSVESWEKKGLPQGGDSIFYLPLNSKDYKQTRLKAGN